MAKNEDGEFELVLGNNQLLSVFVLMVLLLVVCFVGGYFLGRKATPVLNAAATSNGAPIDTVVDTTPTKIVDATKPPEPDQTKEEAPVRTVPQAEPEVAKVEPKPEPVKAKPEPPKPTPKAEPKPEPKQITKAEPLKPKSPEPAKAKPEPPKVEAKGKQGAVTGQPIPGRIYLQLSATEKVKAEVMVDLLRRSNLPGFAAAIPDRPGLFRVLVGPLAETGVNDMKAQLKAKGFPADEAIRRQF